MLASGELRRTSELHPFQQLRPRTEADGSNLAQDDEAFDAVRLFFWAQQNGIVMEMGGLDGNILSVSKEFLPLAWHRILIEATPLWHKNALAVSRDATYVGAAACPKHSRVHFLLRGDSPINGIAEFMTQGFMQIFHPAIYKMATTKQDGSGVTAYDLSNVDWSSPLIDEAAARAAAAAAATAVPDQTFARAIDCVEINEVLDIVHIRHVNFFVLDVEGGELEVLRYVDFDTVRFDVLCIETDAGNRPAGYGAAVANYLLPHGYEVVLESGRNTWFKHNLFTPSARPM